MNEDWVPRIVIPDLDDAALVFKCLTHHHSAVSRALVCGVITVREYMDEVVRLTELQKQLYESIGTIAVDPVDPESPPLSEEDSDAFDRIMKERFKEHPES